MARALIESVTRYSGPAGTADGVSIGMGAGELFALPGPSGRGNTTAQEPARAALPGHGANMGPFRP